MPKSKLAASPAATAATVATPLASHVSERRNKLRTDVFMRCILDQLLYLAKNKAELS
jgi:hypothetical protein